MELAMGIEWLVVLAVVLIVFGVGRIGKLGGELGEGIKAFRKGLSENTDSEEKKTDAR